MSSAADLSVPEASSCSSDACFLTADDMVCVTVCIHSRPCGESPNDASMGNPLCTSCVSNPPSCCSADSAVFFASGVRPTP